MKISRLYVRGFGKIEDFNTEFSNGLNIVYGPNEGGKSTLMTFIKAMLYGLKAGRTSKDGVAPDSKRYAPWGKVPYGGYLNFGLDKGSSYRIDRNFENGEVKLYDSSFNDVTGLFTENKDSTGIAEKLLGLNESLFERTVFVAQMGTRIDTSASKDLIDRISNISQSGSEDVSFKKARTVLKEALKEQVGTDRSYTRPLDIINKRLQELNATKTIIQQEKKLIWDDRAQLRELSINMDKLTKKEKIFAKVIEFCKLKEKLKTLYDKAEEIRFLNESIKQCEKNINSMDKDKELLEQELIDKVKTVDRFSVLGLIAAMGLGWVILFFKLIPPIFSIVPVILAAIFLVQRIKNSRKLKVSVNKDKEAYAERIDHILHQQMVSLKERINSERAQYEQLQKRLELQTLNYDYSDIVAMEKEIDKVSDEISELRISTDIAATATELQLVDNIIERYDEVLYKDIVEMTKFIAVQIQQKKVEYARLEVTINKNEKLQDEGVIDEELARLIQQKESLEQRGEALNIAIKTLEDAANHVQKKYVPVMNKVFKSIFSDLTGQKYSDIRAGENLNIMLNDPKTDMIVPVSILSNGTIDQLYMSLRIAIAETVLKINENLPFIMDEPFAQYDDKRTENALKSIYEISKRQQIIIFTCKEREADFIGNQYPCKICSLT